MLLGENSQAVHLAKRLRDSSKILPRDSMLPSSPIHKFSLLKLLLKMIEVQKSMLWLAEIVSTRTSFIYLFFFFAK